MNNDIAGYVNVPDFLKLTDKNLEYLDILIYASLWSFNNPKDGCFPKHETIGKRAGMSKNFVIESIKRLEAARLITVERSAKKKVSNKYHFVHNDNGIFIRTEKAPSALLYDEGLTANEKAMLLCLRQFFNHGLLTCLEGVSFYAKWLGITYNKVKKQYDNLLKKGYIQEKQVVRKGAKTYIKRYLTDKLQWDGLYIDPKLIGANTKLKVA